RDQVNKPGSPHGQPSSSHWGATWHSVEGWLRTRGPPPLLIWDTRRAKSVPNPCQIRAKSVPNQPADYACKYLMFRNTSACPIRAKSVPNRTRIWDDLAHIEDAETQCFRGL